MLAIHGQRCQLTGCEVIETLEACHIVPVQNHGPDRSDNALLLRSDLHAMFDAGLLSFRKECDRWKVVLNGVQDACYAMLGARELRGFDQYEPFLAERARLDALA